MATQNSKPRSVDFLPEIFQTPANKQFLSATLDQLIQEPDFVQTQGFVGRKVGPGVNAADQYIIEPTKERNDYQLEPAVVSVNPDNYEVTDAITYPGIVDAVSVQGGVTDRQDRLFTSEYYSFDPFVDYDKMVNYSQYFWLPNGPEAVTVSASDVPTTNTFVVTRNNGYYTFSTTAGQDPTLTLARGGTYTFQVAQNETTNITFRVQNNGISSYVIDYQPNPALTLVRGNTYTFDLSLTGDYPFYIKTAETLGTTNQYNNGVLRNGATTGVVTFTVPQDAPNTLYYVNSTQINMRGTLTIVDGTPGAGPGFWIQAYPGVTGVIPSTPNISSRLTVDNGVTNNGIDLGEITFAVPLSTAQDNFYNMPVIGPVSVLSDNLTYAYLNNLSVATFLANYPTGIDGITNLNGLTIIFLNSSAGDSYNIWSVNTTSGSIVLNSLGVPSDNEKFTIQYGTQWASTQWYKNGSAWNQIPLLTATSNVLYYQDGLDPSIVGQISIIDQSSTAVLDIDQILGQPNYTSPNGVVFTNGLKVTFSGTTFPASYENNTYYVEGVGTAIQLLPVSNFVTPEAFYGTTSVPWDTTPWDTTGWDTQVFLPLALDYLTINRASPDLNPWTRSNRWFHIDVIYATAAYNGVVASVDNAYRAKRPILEFRPGTKLFNFGTQGFAPTSLIDFVETNALVDVAGQTSYTVDGIALSQGQTVIFANDDDPTVRNQIFTVDFITPSPSATPVIDLVPTSYSPALINQDTVIQFGDTNQGVSYYYDGVDWLKTQQKTAVNQAPLFNVFDSDDISFSDKVKYPSSSFVGSKLFGYALDANNPVDPILGFPIAYYYLSSIGDIEFANYLYTDTFNYTQGSTSYTINVSDGFVFEYSNRTDFIREIGWQTAIVESASRQQFRFTYDGNPIQLDVAVAQDGAVPAVQLYVDSSFQAPANYSVSTTANTTVITFLNTYTVGAVIEVDVLSDQVSQQAFYTVPVNLENNPLNGNSEFYTLGNIRNHYVTIGENLLNLQGPIIGANNSRDLGNIVPYGQQILQQSSPLTMAGYFLRTQQYEIFQSLEYNSREYIKYKSKLLNAVENLDFDIGTLTVAQILDQVIGKITLGKTRLSPFYWSDMAPTGTDYTSTSTTVTYTTTNVFNTTQMYDFTSSNYLGLLVYVNGALLIRGYDYVVSTDSQSLTINIPLAIGDVVTINEYTDTSGNFIPNTPTKMGLYQKWKPAIYLDESYVNATVVIRGHDGSITVAFGDIRDEVLLEFEKRIYNNIKMDDNPVPLGIQDITRGFWNDDNPTTTYITNNYTVDEINTILGEDFLAWVGWNKLDYNSQFYDAQNPFTYNYSQAGNKLNEQPLPGAWRGIYRLFYGSQTPNITPWEMLGFSEMPTWWENQYGPAPYTSGNLLLWEHLEAGYVADPIAPYIRPNYARPGLTNIIPSGSEGQLLSPLESTVGLYDPNAFKKSWRVGDGGPVEASWWASSSYPFAVMRLLAVTRPAQFFSLFADRDLYKFDTRVNQYVYNGRYRLDANGVQVYGNGTSKASFINWIVDYNQQLGVDSTTHLTTDLQNLDVRLAWRMGSFVDKKFMAIRLERSSPDSTNVQLLLPDNAYDLLLYKNQPFDQIDYSGVIIEIVANGFAVYGYNNIQPFFNIFVSNTAGTSQIIAAGGVQVQVPKQYTQNVVQIPYGFVFTNTTSVVDFIMSYGKYLETQGLIFADVENGYTLDWKQMAQEFLYFSAQGWGQNTMINLNPSANVLQVTQPYAVADTIESVTPENMLLDQNRGVLKTRDLIIDRAGNALKVTVAPTTSQTISFLRLRFTSYEDLVVFQNVTSFGDIIYNPTTGLRQSRMAVQATVSANWNGTLDARGFILNQPNVKEWAAYKKYTRGDIVLYKNQYWQAQTIVQPKATFDYSDWFKSNWDKIDQGLLPNIANKADQLAESYNIHYTNLATDQNLFAYGLTGFRPRQYMTDLNLDIVSQMNLYQAFIKTKGTRAAAQVFTRANFGYETGQYSILENWAILLGTYGANANRSFFELQLNEANLLSNPATVQVIVPGQTSLANQTVYLNDIWAESYKITSPAILPTKYATFNDTALPSAGYVNINDVDITVFSLDNPANIAAELGNIGIGTTIWVAKVNSYDWNVYQAGLVAPQMTQLRDNLNGTSVAQFAGVHGLSVGDLIIIKYFNDSINGVYRVLTVPSTTTVTILYEFVNTNQTSITGTGLVFQLQTMRVKQASDIASLDYVNNLIPGATVWVDNDGNGHWTVLQKQNVYTATPTTLLPQYPDPKMGQSISQSANNQFAYVGSPGNGTTAGVLYHYVASIAAIYSFESGVSLTATDTLGFGYSVSSGFSQYTVVGAPYSNTNSGYATVIYDAPRTIKPEIAQILLPFDFDYANALYGTAVTISQDERWIYVGAPGTNKVYAWAQVQVPTTTTQTFTGNGTTAAFTFSTVVPQNNSIYSFSITLNNDIQRPFIDYTYNATTQTVTFTTVPALNDTIVVTAGTYYTPVSVITVSGLPNYAQFGYSISTSTDGAQIIIGAPKDDVGTVSRAGSAYFFDRSVERYLISNTAQTTYAIPGTFTAPVSVQLNGTFLTNTAQYSSGQFTVVGNTIVLDPSVTLTIGDVLEIGTNQFNQLQQFSEIGAYDQSLYGYATTMCDFNCSAYIGAPHASTNTISQSGLVDRVVNKARVYGVITSTIANPTLTPGSSIRVNNTEVLVPNVPNNTVAGVVSAINTSGIPNVIASVLPNVTLYGDGTTQIFDVGTIYSDADSYTPVVYLNGVIQTLNTNYAYNNTTQQISFTAAPTFGSTITVVAGRLTISVIDINVADATNKLSVLPGAIGSAYYQLGFDAYAWTQTITSAFATDFAFFGSSISIDDTSTHLLIGAPNATAIEPTTFDGNKTYFDESSTTFFDDVLNSGMVYTYDYLPSANDSANNPGQFAFGEQIFNSTTLDPNNAYGTAVSYVGGRLLIGAPGNDTTINTNYSGYVNIFTNLNDAPVWTPIHVQQPVVDIYELDAVYSYNAVTKSTQTYYDFFDPLQGKIIGAAASNINYRGAVDPASYNEGAIHNNGNAWGAEHIGEIWWDTDMVRFLNPNQDDIVYASRRWGTTFPGSRVDIYQWIESTVPPVNYAGEGTPLSTISYTVNTVLDKNNVFQVRYYYWVRNISTIATGAGKTLSTTGIASYITSPLNSGIPYVAPLNASTLAIYNGSNFISAQNTILHVGFDQKLTNANIHQEFQLIPDGREEAFLTPALYRKFLDSFAGADTAGNIVPDPSLAPSERYGVQFRPRQTMFINRFLALQNYLTYANNVLIQYPISETRSFNLLNSQEAMPTQFVQFTAGKFTIGTRYTINSIGTTDFTAIGASANTVGVTFIATGVGTGTGTALYYNWNYQVPNLQILGYQDINAQPVGTTYLVDSDSSEKGLWTIYAVVPTAVSGVNALDLTRVQGYYTPFFWNYVDWYLPGYNKATLPLATVPHVSALETISTNIVPIGGIAKISANAQGNWELYQRITDSPIIAYGWQRVGLQNGTVQFSETLWNYALGKFGWDGEVFDNQYWDQVPNTETRNVIRALCEEIYVGDLLIHRNQSLILMFRFAYSENTAPEWLIETSLVDVAHQIRSLEPYQTYIQDNQNFVLDYIQEVKPYHVQVRAFDLVYTGQDDYQGSMTDFDCPAYFDTVIAPNQYISPVLLPYDHAATPVISTAADTDANAQIWLEQPWDYWYNNYTMSLDSVTIIDPGTTYTSAPTLTVNGACTTQATIIANVDVNTGFIVSITVTNPGAGYTETPTITITGGGGTGTLLYPNLGNQLVRSFKVTLKYDRYQYQSTVVPWQASTAYPAGQLVRYANTVWSADAAIPNTQTQLDPDFWTLVPAEDLSGVDRTAGYYVAEANSPGLNLPLLMTGIDYPGVQVWGVPYDEGNSYVIASTSTTLDTVFESYYGNTTTGQIPTGTANIDINIAGGQYISTFASHAPEELVPGAMFDTLDFRTLTSPVTDYVATGNITGPYAAPAGSSNVIVSVNGITANVANYSFSGGAVTFTTAPAANSVIGIVNTDPSAILDESFRIFQDMRQVQETFAMPVGNTTVLANTLSSVGNTIYVGNAAGLTQPSLNNNTTGITNDPADNLWGVITIDGERIMYRDIDYTANTVSSLIRGTAGTATGNVMTGTPLAGNSLVYSVGTTVYNMSEPMLAQEIYQNYIDDVSHLADGTQTVFILLTNVDSSLTDAVEVYVGGYRMYAGYTITDNNPITVTFTTAPPEGVDVTILVRRGRWWDTYPVN